MTLDHLPRPDGARLAYSKVAGAGPAVVWLGGFHSDMQGAKAVALHDWAVRAGRAYIRFDYFGHGQSSGAFEDGTIGRWREDALAVIDQLTDGPVVLVGSSMGGWLACLAALARPERVVALVLIAPAADFTHRLIQPQLSDDALRALAEDGVWVRPSAYDQGYPITARLLEEGRDWSILPEDADEGALGITARVRILQGGADPDVPWRHALRLADALAAPDLVFTLIKDGDHRLSRPTDLLRMIAAVVEVSVEAASAD